MDNETNMKNMYVSPELEILPIGFRDVIVTSEKPIGGGGVGRPDDDDDQDPIEKMYY